MIHSFQIRLEPKRFSLNNKMFEHVLKFIEALQDGKKQLGEERPANTSCLCFLKKTFKCFRTKVRFFNNGDAILNFEHIAMHCGLYIPNNPVNMKSFHLTSFICSSARATVRKKFATCQKTCQGKLSSIVHCFITF